MLSIKPDDLADKIVGPGHGGKRKAIRWPEKLLELLDAHKSYIRAFEISIFFAVTFVVVFPVIVGWRLMFCSQPASLAAALMGSTLASFGCFFWSEFWPSWESDEDLEARYGVAFQTMESLCGKDPYLTLRSAAFLTVGAMPEWLKTRMNSEPGSGVSERQWALAAGEPTPEQRAGLEYLDLMLKIENGLDTGKEGYRGETFPEVDYRLPNSLKEAVGKIILVLSSLPDSWEEPREDTVKVIMENIGRLATIRGASFAAALRDAKSEELARKIEAENRKNDAYDNEIMDALKGSPAPAPTDEGYKAILRGMDRLDKINMVKTTAMEAADGQAAVASRPTD